MAGIHLNPQSPIPKKARTWTNDDFLDHVPGPYPCWFSPRVRNMAFDLLEFGCPQKEFGVVF